MRLWERHRLVYDMVASGHISSSWYGLSAVGISATLRLASLQVRRDTIESHIQNFPFAFCITDGWRSRFGRSTPTASIGHSCACSLLVVPLAALIAADSRSAR